MAYTSTPKHELKFLLSWEEEEEEDMKSKIKIKYQELTFKILQIIYVFSTNKI